MNRLASPPRQANAPSPLDDVLAAPLQSALNSLNVQLERELARYRYARQGQALPAKPVFKPRQRPLNLISVGAKPISSAPPGAAQGRPTPPQPPPNPRLQGPRSGEAAGIPHTQAIPPLWSGGDLVPQPTPASDYMASSEALLESLGDDSPESMPAYEPPAPSWTQALATPLGMGALLLLLVVSGGLGYVLVNPAAVSHLANLWPFGAASDSASDTAVAPEDGGDGVPSAGDRPGTDLSPNLSEQEFVRLDLSALSTLPLSAIRPPSLASTPTAAVDSTPTTTAIAPTTAPAAPSTAAPTPSSAAAPSASRPAAPAVPRQTPAAAPAPRPAAASPRPAPAPAASTAPATPAPVATSTYYVVTSYTGDPSLNQARQVVGDAYVRNFPIGARIQLGAFSSEADAAAHAQTLTDQGISAEVYNP